MFCPWEILVSFSFIAAVVFVCVSLVQIAKIIWIMWKVDRQSTAYGGIVVAEVLRCHGVENIFTLVGGHISPILVAAESLGIRVVDARHEASAVFAADAAARLSGRIGVAAVTAGPGVTNTVTAIKNAQLAESPVLLIGGATASILKGRGALQDIDQLNLLKSACKHSVSVKAVKDIIPAMKTAINKALCGVPGPVFVELPIDILYPYSVVRKEVIGNRQPSTLVGYIVNWYLEYYLSTLFTAAWEPRDLTPLPIVIPLPNPNLVECAAFLLTKSERPLMLIGSQAMLIPNVVAELQEAVIKIGLPTYLGGMARGLLGTGCVLQLRHGRSEALKKADFVLLAGSVCDFRLSYGRLFSKNARIVTVNRDLDQANKNSGVFWNPSLTVVGDVAAFLLAFGDCVAEYVCNDAWLNELREVDAEKERAAVEMSERVGRYLNPLRVLYELDKKLTRNCILVADGGDFVGSAAYILRPRGPLRWLDPGAFGTLGVGGGFALGAKVTCPNAQVWIIYGDGACGYSIAEFDTFVRHNLPVIALVGNDAGWTQIEREQKSLFDSSVACVLAHTNYHIVAEGYGAEGLITSCRNNSPSPVFERGQALYAAGKSVLINALIGKTTFRDGSISV